MPKTKRKRMRRKHNPDLPGMDGPGVAQERNPTLERLADDWIDNKEKLEAIKETTETARESLASQMRSTNTYVYKYDGHLIRLEPGKDKITVKDVEEAETVE